MSDVAYTHVIAGNAAFMRKAIDALCEDLAPALEALGWSETSADLRVVPALQISSRPQALAAEAIALGFGTWLFVKTADKIYDAVYSETLKTPLELSVSRVLKYVRGFSDKAIEYQSLVYIEDLDVSVLVRMFFEAEADILGCTDKINAAHKIAYEWLKANGKKANIHCHTIVKGHCQLEPTLFKSINDIKKVTKNRVRKVSRVRSGRRVRKP